MQRACKGGGLGYDTYCRANFQAGSTCKHVDVFCYTTASYYYHTEHATTKQSVQINVHTQKMHDTAWLVQARVCTIYPLFPLLNTPPLLEKRQRHKKNDKSICPPIKKHKTVSQPKTNLGDGQSRFFTRRGRYPLANRGRACLRKSIQPIAFCPVCVAEPARSGSGRRGKAEDVVVVSHE